MAEREKRDKELKVEQDKLLQEHMFKIKLENEVTKFYLMENGF